MTTEEILLTVLTVAVVILIAIVVTLLILIISIARKVNHVADHVQTVTDKGVKVVGTLAPLGAVAGGLFQALKILTIKRR